VFEKETRAVIEAVPKALSRHVELEEFLKP
jgi:hypothetical protein